MTDASPLMTGMRFPCLAAALVLLLAPALSPGAQADTTDKWKDGDAAFEWASQLTTGGQLTKNISLSRYSEVQSATVRVRGQPFPMDAGTDYQTLHWPVNPSMDLNGDGTLEWKFPGTMGMQREFAPNTTALDLRWESKGLTKGLDLGLPRSTINDASFAVNNSQTANFAYTMSVGDRTVWERNSLSFSLNRTSYTNGAVSYVTTADISDDGWMDIVGCGPNAKIYLSRSIKGRFANASFIDCQIASAQNDLLMIAAGNLDDAPGIDLAAACADGNIYILLNQGGAGLFGGATKIDSGVASRMASVTIADVDQDGLNDIIAGNLNGKFYVFFNDGGAQFDTSGGPGSDSFKVVNAGSGQMNDVCVADINMDTFPDLIGACSNRQFYVALSLGARDCNASYPVVTGAIRDMNSVDAVDVDKDGDFDLVGASNDGKMYICINLGNMQGFHPGDFSTQPGSIVKITLESGTNSLRSSIVEDVNGDEWPDIVALGSSNNGQVYLIINDGFGTYPDTNIYRMFSAGQTSKSIAAAPLVRAGFVDLLVDNGDRMDVWQNGAGPFSEVVSGPGLVSALQGAVDNASAVLDGYGNPMVNVRISISNKYVGLLHFDDLAINYTYNALVDFTKPLSDLLNVTNRTGEEMLSIPVVFKMDSAGVLKISNLSIDSQIRLVAFIDSPADGSGLYLNRSYTLQGHSNYDLDGELFNYSWTDLSSGRLLGYGSQCRFTPSAKGDLTVQLKVRSDIGKSEAVASARLSVVDGPAAALDIAKMTMKPREPGEGDIVTLSVTFRNTGNLNATNIGFQVFLDSTGGLPIASGVLDRVDAGRTATATAAWQAGRPGAHKVIIRITQSDVPFTTPVQPFQTSVNVRRAQPGYPVELIAYGTFIGLGAAAAAAFFLTTEIGKYLGLSLFLPLYSKLQPEEVLDRFIRGKILGYIRANPGAHYNLIKQDLDLHNGTLVHHLDTLERNGFIRSARDGTLKRFFPGNGKVPEGRFYMSPIQDSISRYIGANPGVSQADISRGLYIEPHIVRYHVNVLREARVLRVEEEGNRTKLFLN